MANPGKFLLPSPNFGKNETLPAQAKPHYLTPSGMTLHRRDQPPPMYGKRGATTPAKYLQQQRAQQEKQASNNQPNSGQEEPRSYCEACDMELQCGDDLRRHRAQHECCPVDGCSYRGLASVMDKHVSALHASGLFDKFKKLSTPEEIVAWRAERQRRYPTVANVEMRQRAQEQRQRRGERLVGNKNRFGKPEDRRRAQAGGAPERNVEAGAKQAPRERKSKKRRHGKDTRKEKAAGKEVGVGQATKVVEQSVYESDSCLGVRMFKGTGQLANYEHAKPKKQKIVNALSNLLGMYGSDEDENEEEEKEDALDEGQCVDPTDELTKQPIESVHETINTIQGAKSIGQVEPEQTDAASVPTQDRENLFVSHEQVETKTAAAISQVTENPSTIEGTATGVLSSTVERECSPNSIEHAVDAECVNTGTKSNSDDDEAPEEAPIARSTDYKPSAPRPPQPLPSKDVPISPPSKRPKCEQQPRSKITPPLKRKSGLDYRKARLRKQNTMLEKLLEPDIRHERNVLLQCVRFVCENDFFGIGEKPATPPSDIVTAMESKSDK